jgi:hypothetical protein
MNLLTHEEVIERLCECPQARRYAITCVLPAVWCGDGWRFRESDLEAWIAQHIGTPRNAEPERASS